MRARIVLLGLALLTTAIAFAPEAAAECQPLLDPHFCDGIGPEPRPLPPVPERCWWTEYGIYCE